MKTKEIIENAVELFSGMMNFTDDDGKEALEEKKSLTPLRIHTNPTPGGYSAEIKFMDIVLFQADLQSSIEGKASIEESAFRNILFDIIISGVHAAIDRKGIQRQMKIKKNWMVPGCPIKISGKNTAGDFGEIDSLDEIIIDGVEYVYYINIKVPGKKKTVAYPPGVVLESR